MLPYICFNISANTPIAITPVATWLSKDGSGTTEAVTLSPMTKPLTWQDRWPSAAE